MVCVDLERHNQELNFIGKKRLAGWMDITQAKSVVCVFFLVVLTGYALLKSLSETKLEAKSVYSRQLTLIMTSYSNHCLVPGLHSPFAH